MLRRAVFLVLALCLAACGDPAAHAPFTDSRLPPGLSQADWPPHGWTWGLIRNGSDPQQRYGVAAAATVPRAEVLILPGYGDFAETHFAEAGGLIGKGDTVWILDGAGQGGSGRLAGPRDLGHVAAFDGDLQAVGVMAQKVIRPGADAPLFLIAEGTAAPVALRALQLGRIHAAGLILVDPTLKPPVAIDLGQPRWASRLLFGAVRAPGGGGWDRNSQPKDPAGQRRILWQTANPDLRMGGPSLGWLATFDDLVRQTQGDGLGKVVVPVLVISTGQSDAGEDNKICQALPHCVRQSLATLQTLGEVEGAFIQNQMPANALAPWTSAVSPEDDHAAAPTTPFDVPR